MGLSNPPEGAGFSKEALVDDEPPNVLGKEGILTDGMLLPLEDM